MFASGVPPAWCSPMPTSPLTCLLLRWVPAHTGSATHTPAWGGLDSSCCVPCAGTLGAAAKAPQQPASSEGSFSWKPFVRQWSRSQGRGGLWECGISGSWSAVAPSLHHPPSVLHHPPSFLPPSQSVLGLVVVVAPALVVPLAPAVVTVVLAPVTLPVQYSRFPCCGPLALPTRPVSSRCSAAAALPRCCCCRLILIKSREPNCHFM